MGIAALAFGGGYYLGNKFAPTRYVPMGESALVENVDDSITTDVNQINDSLLKAEDARIRQRIIWVNGKKAGEWAYGYNTFRVDVTPFLAFDGSDNEIEVRLKNVEESSRWYFTTFGPVRNMYEVFSIIKVKSVNAGE